MKAGLKAEDRVEGQAQAQEKAGAERERVNLLEKCPTCGRPLEEHERERVTMTWRAIIQAYEAGLRDGERRSRLWGLRW